MFSLLEWSTSFRSTCIVEQKLILLMLLAYLFRSILYWSSTMAVILPEHYGWFVPKWKKIMLQTLKQSAGSKQQAGKGGKNVCDLLTYWIIIIMKNFKFPWSPWPKVPWTGAIHTLAWIARIHSHTHINTVKTMILCKAPAQVLQNLESNFYFEGTILMLQELLETKVFRPQFLVLFSVL